MLKIDIKSIPNGRTELTEKIGEISIVNSGDHEDPNFGNYNATVYGKIGVDKIRIENHYRDDGWIYLLKQVLDELC